MKSASSLPPAALLIGSVVFACAAQAATAAKGEQAESNDPSGTWRLEYDWNEAHVKEAFRLKVDDAGAVVGTLAPNADQSFEISNGKLSGNELTFTVSGDNQGTQWVTKYAGTIDGDKIEGTVVLEANGQSWDFPWRPRRSVQMEDVVGAWQIRIESPDGSIIEPTMEIREDDGRYDCVYTTQRAGVLDVKQLRVEDNHLVFTVTAEFNGTAMTVDYKGRPYGDKIQGTLEYDFGGNRGQAEFTAHRKSEKNAREQGNTESDPEAADGDDQQQQSAVAPPRNGQDNAVGRRVPTFVLPDTAGNQVALSDFSHAKVIVVVFMGTSCPIGNAYVPDLNDLHKRYKDRDVQVIGINSNLSDSAETIAEHVQEFQVVFPVLVDENQLAADLFGAERTPEAFVLDRRRNIRYRGRIDDRVGYDFKRDKSRRSDAEEAVKELLAGGQVSVPETGVEGCLITRRSSLRKSGEITYASHVARILHAHCANCHHPGTAAPFSLLNYEDARNWSEMIREVVVQRRMPPWNVDPRYGKFINDLRMPKEEIDTLVAWINDGAPLGDIKDLPEPPQYANGWTMGEPDVVFKMPKEYTVQATGTVEYQYFVTPTNFEEDVWVQASEARPGNWGVVHHIIAFIREKGSNSRSNLVALGGFAPGEEPMMFPDGVGLKVPAGAEIVWQVHYTPTGKVETDRSELGLIFCKEPPHRAAKGGGAFNFTFNIPPGAGNHQVVSRKRFNKDVELLSLMPHMHLRGKDFRYTAHFPDGTQQILLNVPDYDFNWQHRYRFAEPFFIPKGTTIECVAHFDNSAENPANPDPSKTVRWGDQTWEEMMIGWYSHVVVPDRSSDDEN